MWETLDAGRRWIYVNHDGRIIGRVRNKDGEYGASCVVVTPEVGIGEKVFLGYYASIREAKIAIENRLNVRRTQEEIPLANLVAQQPEQQG